MALSRFCDTSYADVVPGNLCIQVKVYDMASDKYTVAPFYSTSPTVPLQSELPMIVAIDPSKSAMGVVIGDIAGNSVRFLNISGSGVDTTYYCLLMRKFLAETLKDLNIVSFKQERVILSDTYVSVVVLNEVRSAVTAIALNDLYLRKSIIDEVNNWSWKAATLPAEYRKKIYKKGSQDYFRELFPMCRSIDDNLTDAYFIYQYALQEYTRSNPVYCNASERVTPAPTIAYVSGKQIDDEKMDEFSFNPMFSVLDNLHYYAHRRHSIGCCKIPWTSLTVDDIYAGTSLVDHTVDVDDLYAVVRRN